MPRSIWIRTAELIGLGGAALAVFSLCGCSAWERFFPASAPSLSNSDAIDRAVRLCSLKAGERPFHLVLEIAPPEKLAVRGLPADMHATVEVFWLNPITFRTEIRSQSFTQTRIVNGRAVEEHDTGDFYPRWIENFADALLDPVPEIEQLKKVSGKVPVGVQAHACISAPAGDTETAEICFQDTEPRIASGVDATRSVWFDNFAPFGPQQVARTLVDDLPDGLLVRGQVTLLETLPQADYPLLKATEFNLPEQQIATALAPESAAEPLLSSPPPLSSATALSQPGAATPAGTRAIGDKTRVLIRTDRTGQVREAYLAAPGLPGRENWAVTRALAMRFKPLAVDGVARQMETVVALP